MSFDRRHVRRGLSLLVLAALCACSSEEPQRAVEARSYLRQRAAAWMNKSDWEFVHDGTCALSCHSTLPYVLSHDGAADDTLSELRRRVEERVQNWAGVAPHYAWNAEASRATEAVLNGIVITWQEAVLAGQPLGPLACAALEHLWAAQEADGAWRWMDEKLSPWEDAQARSWSAALVAMTMARAGTAAEACAGAQRHARGLARVWQYLDAHRDDMNLHARLVALWADRLAGAHHISAAQRDATLAALRALARRDGGFASRDLGEFRPLEAADADRAAASDGYATGLAVLVLHAAGTAEDAPLLGRAVTWLERNQRADGTWPGQSLNRPRSELNNRFFTDAATAYASWALRVAVGSAGR
jgi:hypothetical protein